ncbi:beta-ketoacyl-[acyl-carrier-protein] synthase family protein [Parasulfuritortus cantonensis]|uniref:Beta-ketoacyl-[acyl-carrier-protein] synthase family protein n=1 Tax=Parasulfuritortus cantonensis TaxID=2528202 RepID=A0A4V2NW32_9PROT|nr:beta-ketoacyl-[acyl-carrier-protein] synthase family protein [Parasulfuritortus cantonensis]TCJ15782.1 beta-ketoacyl-[acyl-carrier-protein] synthase family protein [Parasulfuritortus cantonensis]
MQPLAVNHHSLVNALGRGTSASLQGLRSATSGLRRCDFLDVGIETYIGRVDGIEDEPVVARLRAFDCRNNRLAMLGLAADGFESAVAAARARYGAHRIAVIIGTSTSAILETEVAYRQRDAEGRLPGHFNFRTTHDNYSVTQFVRSYLGLQGPSMTISTACSSSAKVFASASRLIQAGFCDAAVVGGVDSLCMTTLYGFASLEVLSSRPCRPADADRSGISIGEAAGFALLEKTGDDDTPRLLGYGESSDAYHMSSPHPEGAGARRAMASALQRSGLGPEQIDYINLHGTATRANDSAEDLAVSGLFGSATPCSSTKGWTGHTLGAAGITEALLSCLCLREGRLPASLNTVTVDPDFKMNVLLESRDQPVRHVLSNSFGFGGNNCSLVFGYPEK